MRYVALATDYDGTLADAGIVREEVVEALRRLRDSGRRLVLVTGRELGDLLTVFPDIELFEYVVAENGALLYHVATRTERVLASAPDERLLLALRTRGVMPIESGRVIVATREPHETTVLDVIRELGLELQVIFNKGAVMIVPSGVNKATGLAAALMEMELSPHNVVSVGDAENDHALLGMSEAAIAVANALPALREQADLVTQAPAGLGVVELVDALLADDLAALAPRQTRHRILVGSRSDGSDVAIDPYGVNVMVCGTSGSGKSTLTTGLLERFAERGYEFCLLDPEGDYQQFAGALVLGDQHNAPTVEEVMQVTAKPGVNAIVNLLGIPLADRPAFLDAFLTRMQELRTRTGRPHWLVIDEAHHMLQPPLAEGRLALAQALENVVLITPHPLMVDEHVLARVDAALTVGSEVARTIQALASARGLPAPSDVPEKLEGGEAYFWMPTALATTAATLRTKPSQVERRRHERKYAEGELGMERSFYFRGADGKFNLRAQNLMMFMQIADGLDDDTWRFHLERGDYSRWFRDMIKDDDLARAAERIERRRDGPGEDTRAAIREAIESRYTLPGTLPSGSSTEEPAQSDSPTA
jgi:hydroxymethylpyrimidine pyrophosphatase-like HAD family hydrolase